MAETTPFEFQLESPTAWERRAKVSLTAQQLDNARAQVVEELRRSVTMPGFRKGKVPLDVIRRDFASRIDQQALESLIPDAYRHIIEQYDDLHPVAEPRVENLHMHEGEGAHFDIVIEVRPQVTLANYKGLAVERPLVKVTEQHVDRALGELAERGTQWVPVHRQARQGDALMISFAPLLEDGSPNEAERTNDYAIELGADGVLPEFNSALEGMQPEEDTRVDVQYPADYPREDLRGRAMRFHVQLKEVREKRVPTLDDEFARSISRHANLAELRQDLQGQLERHGKRESDRILHEQLIDGILSVNDVPVPPTLEARYLQAILQDLERGSRRPMDDEMRQQLSERFRPAARRAVQRLFVLEALRNAEGLAVDDAELEARITQMAADQQVPAEDLRRAIQGGNNMERLRNDLVEEKVFALLEQHATVTLVERKPEDEAAAQGAAGAAGG